MYTIYDGDIRAILQFILKGNPAYKIYGVTTYREFQRVTEHLCETSL